MCYQLIVKHVGNVLFAIAPDGTMTKMPNLNAVTEREALRKEHEIMHYELQFDEVIAKLGEENPMTPEFDTLVQKLHQLEAIMQRLLRVPENASKIGGIVERSTHDIKIGRV